MSFRIVDLIGDKISNSTDSNLKSPDRDLIKDKAIVSSTSEDFNSSKSPRRAFAEEPLINHRLNSDSSFAPVNLVNNQRNLLIQPSKLGLSTFDDYASKLYSHMYYEQLYLPPPALIANTNTSVNSSVMPYGGLEKALSSSYPSMYSRARPSGWSSLYPPAPTQALTHHHLSPFLYSPLVYTHYSKRKGGQVRFTTSQTDTLERRFQSHKYLSPEDRRVLAESLKLSDRQVKTWFQNRRAKWRRSHDGLEKNPESLECHSSDSDADQMMCASPDHQLNQSDT